MTTKWMQYDTREEADRRAEFARAHGWEVVRVLPCGLVWVVLIGR